MQCKTIKNIHSQVVLLETANKCSDITIRKIER